METGSTRQGGDGSWAVDGLGGVGSRSPTVRIVPRSFCQFVTACVSVDGCERLMYLFLLKGWGSLKYTFDIVELYDLHGVVRESACMEIKLVKLLWQ